MNINNGSTPASPIDITDDFHMGLTKFEAIAMNAPPVPDWFIESFTYESEVEKPIHTDEEARLAGEYSADNYGLSAEDFNTGSRISSELSIYHEKCNKEFNRRSFFAWRTYYASNLLAELSRTSNEDQSTHDRLMQFVKTAASLLNESDHNSATVKMLALDILRDAE